MKIAPDEVRAAGKDAIRGKAPQKIETIHAARRGAPTPKPRTAINNPPHLSKVIRSREPNEKTAAQRPCMSDGLISTTDNRTHLSGLPVYVNLPAPGCKKTRIASVFAGVLAVRPGHLDVFER